MRTAQRTVALAVLILVASTAYADSKVYTIQDAYDAALKSNEAIMISGENAIQAENRLDQAWTFLYPRLTANGSYTQFDDVLPPGGGSFIFQPLRQFNASLVLTQPLYTGGRTLAALRAARVLRESGRNDFFSSKQTVMLGVAEAYFGVLKAQKFVEVSKNSLARMERHKKVTEREAKTRKSKMNVSSLLRANTLVNQARIALVRAEDGLKIARQKLSLLTKLPEDLSVADPQLLTAPAGALETLRQTAVQNRADYESAKLNQQAAAEIVTVTRGAHYPQMFAEGGVRYQDSQPQTGLDATTYYAGVRLQIPIFEGGLMKAEVAEAKSRQRQAELASALLKRIIESEVHEALTNLQTFDVVLETAGLLFGDAKKNFDTVESLFSEGLVPSLSLIDAEQALSLSEKELVSATWDRQLAILRLERSMGLLGKSPEGAMAGR
jgi:outer membrane protein